MRLAPFLAALLATPAVLAPAGASPQATALQCFGVRDGLAHERVNCFFEDRLGFLWIGTWEGLSRFDGREFQDFGTADGLTSPLVWCVGEAPSGRLWIGTHCGGMARQVAGARGRTAFEPVRVAPRLDDDAIFDFSFADDGALLAVTPEGIRRCADPDAAAPDFELLWKSEARTWDVQAIVHAGGWTCFLGAFPLVAVRGREVVLGPAPSGDPPRESVHAQPDADGNCFVVTTAGVAAFAPGSFAAPGGSWLESAVRIPDDETIHAITSPRSGPWLGTVHGVQRVENGDATRSGVPAGLPDSMVRTLWLDRAGSLWVGMQVGGVAVLRRGPIETLAPCGRTDPLFVVKIAESLPEHFVASTYSGLWRAEGGALVPLTEANRRMQLGDGFSFHSDADGFWIGGRDALLRVRSLWPLSERIDTIALGDHVRPFGETFVARDGGAWVGGFDGRLYHVAPGAERGEAVDFPADVDAPPRTFAQDAAGRIWVAPSNQLWRQGADGSFARVAVAGLPEPLQPRVLALDDRGHLWVGTRFHGAFELSLESDPPVVVASFSTRDGLPSDHVPALAVPRAAPPAGEARHLWLGTGRGLVRLEPETRALRVFGTEDGLAGSTVLDLLLDDGGRLWIATAGGLGLLAEDAKSGAAETPAAYVAEVVAGGRSTTPARSGALELEGVVVPSERRELVARFDAVALASGRALRFEHRLEEQDRDWSAPGPGSTVSYAGLAPGRYALSMRAIAPSGVRSRAARVRFEVLAPLWQRPWFVALALLSVAAAGVAVHKVRVARALALERVRTQIATDLHDDAGANLAQIAILAEVARKDAPAGDARLLSDVAELARATRGSIADLVWAVDPRRDTLLDLVQRVRGVATHLFESGATRVEFRAPPSEALAAIELDPSMRRHLLFLLQEALNNASRHAAARAVEVEFTLAPGRLPRRLIVRLRDDGRGFDPTAPTEGHGVASVRRRARAIGAELALESSPGHGTSLALDVPLARRPRILVRWRRAGRRGRIEG